MLVFKCAKLIDYEIARNFWSLLLEPKKYVALQGIQGVCDALKMNLHRIPDARSREILGQGLDWAQKHPEALQFHMDRKVARKTHFPNYVAFVGLLDGLENYSRRTKRRVYRITHDRQSEFERTLSAWHDLLSNAKPGDIDWAGETHSVRRVVGSQFQVMASHASGGLQVTDIALWLFKQMHQGANLPNGCEEILFYILNNGWMQDFSFRGVAASWENRYHDLVERPLTPEQEHKGRKMLEEIEAHRQRSIAQYEADRIPPFARGLVGDL